MPLIPSESLNFPDGFRATVGWRLAKQKEVPVSPPQVAAAPQAKTEPSIPLGAESKLSTPAPNPPPPSDHKPIDPEAEAEEPNAAPAPVLAGEESSETPEEPPSVKVAVQAAIETPEFAAATDLPQPAPSSLVELPDPEPLVHQQAAAPTPAPTKMTSMEFASTEAAPQKPMIVEGPAAHALFMQALLGRSVPVEMMPAAEASTELPPAESPIAEQPPPPAPGPAVTVPPVSPPMHPPEMAATSPEETNLQEIAQPELAFERPSSAPPPTRKVPARIPITPRKWKPRSPVQVASVPATAEPDLPDQASSEVAESEQRLHGNGHQPLRPPTNETPATIKQSPIITPEPATAPERISRPWAELARAEMQLFAASERRNRWIRFTIFESAALICLIVLGRLAIWHHFVDPTLTILVVILLIAALATAVTLPIVFLRNSPERWQDWR
jgi:hypothetical protein